MKRFLDVESTRRAYHADRLRNSVHRASLMVPEMPGAVANISFLNHFLLKRNYRHVACRVSAIDPEGKRIESRLFPVDEPRVYTIPLSGMVADTVDSYMVEFFAPDNLFIPFPAVMVNHVGDGFRNSVHAYNRVLNDVFEDDDINAQHQREAAIDVRCDDVAETFIVFHAGPRPVDGVIEAELQLPTGAVLKAEVPIKSPKLCRTILRVSEIFPDLPKPISGGVLKVSQPKQFLFYGRMLVGQMTRDGSFSANHSYYDCADFPEYWENDQASSRVYPYLPGYQNILRFYPIISPGDVALEVDLHGHVGDVLATGEIGTVSTPNGTDLHASVETFAAGRGIADADIAAFTVRGQPTSGNTPTRINHQLVYGAGGLESSINISLGNPNVFVPEGKTGFGWGQVPVGGDVSTSLGLVGMMPRDEVTQFSAKFYTGQGHVLERDFEVAPNGAAIVRIEELLGDAIGADAMAEGDYAWYQVSSPRADISAFVASSHVETGHTVGEHNF